MTICHTLELSVHTVTVEYDRDADWDSHWVIVLSSHDRSTEIRRYCSYTEARKDAEEAVNSLRTINEESRTK